MISSANPQTDETMIEAKGLSKFYREFAAARDITFSVPRGERYRRTALHNARD